MTRAMIRMRGSMGAAAGPPLSLTGLRHGLGASVSGQGGGLSSGIMTASWSCRAQLCNRKELCKQLSCLLGTGIIEPEMPPAKNSQYFAKCRAEVLGRQRTLRPTWAPHETGHEETTWTAAFCSRPAASPAQRRARLRASGKIVAWCPVDRTACLAGN